MKLYVNSIWYSTSNHHLIGLEVMKKIEGQKNRFMTIKYNVHSFKVVVKWTTIICHKTITKVII